jgi:PHD/YefM family antitoxin component YafN of YafNO toxin-antitoxin module
MQTLNVATASISEVKVSPSKVFRTAESTDNGVYVFNRGTVVGVMLTQEQYERLTDGIEILTERLIEIEAENRLRISDVVTFMDSEIRGTIPDSSTPIEMNDGWD